MTATRLRTMLAVLLLVLLAAGCSDDSSEDGNGGGTDTGTADTGGGDGSGSDAGVGGGDYPAGPYGVAVEDVIENHVFQQVDGAELSFADLRSAGNTVLFLNTAAGWCTACREEQPAVQALYEQYSDRGLTVLVTVFEDNSSNVATLEFVESWIEQYSLTFPVVLDADFVMEAYYDATSTPMNMVVDLNTMEIAYISVGEDLDTVEQIVSVFLN